MIRHSALLFILFAAGCGDGPLITNSCTRVYDLEFTAPADGLVNPSETWWVEAAYGGPSADEVTETLSLVLDGALALSVAGAVVEESIIRIPIEPGSVDAGEHTLTLTVGTPEDVCSYAVATLTFAVGPNTRPVPAILPPIVSECAGFWVDVTATDPDQDDGTLVLSWSDPQGLGDYASLPTSAPGGSASFFVPRVPANIYQLTMTATDVAGAAVSANEVITIQPSDCDGDGLVWSQDDPLNAATLDCDDGDPDISPFALEYCDGVDNDCDGDVDEPDAEDASTWYADTDNDTYGDPDSALVQCAQPSGYGADDQDCDDTEAGVNPAATEICNGLDDDCDGRIDVDPDPSDPDATWYFADTDGDGWGDPNAPTLGCGQTPPAGLADDDFDCDDTNFDVKPLVPEVCGNGIDDDCNGIADDDCVVNECDGRSEIQLPETWGPDVIHHVSCDLLVHSELTIEDGTTVQFTSGKSMLVGRDAFGSVQIQGSTEGVTLTGNTPQPAGGIQFLANTQPSLLQGFTFDNAQGIAISVQGGDVELRDCTIMNARNHGVQAQGFSQLRMSGCDVVANYGYGVYVVHDTTTLGDGTGGSFSGNLIADNLDHPVFVRPSQVAEIAADNQFVGNFRNTVLVTSGLLEQDATWNALPVPYQMQGHVNVGGASGATLTIDPGAVLEWEGGGLYIGSLAPGQLVIDAAADPVVMTSAAVSPLAGDWFGVRTEEYDLGTTIKGLTTEYAAIGVSVAEGGDVAVEQLTALDNELHGVRVIDADSRLIVVDSHLERASQPLIYAAHNVGGVTVTGTTITGGLDVPIRIGKGHPEGMGTDNVLTGNADDRIELVGGEVERSAAWPDPGVPYLVVGDLEISGATSPVLTLEDGVVLHMNTLIDVGTTNGNPGGLAVNGTSQGVLVTSAQASPTIGDWLGIRIRDTATDQILDGLTVEYAGLYGLNLRGGATRIQNSVIARNLEGIWMNGPGPTIEIADTEVRDNLGIGVHVEAGLVAELSNSVITGNGDVPLQVPRTRATFFDDTSTYTGNGDDRVRVAGSGNLTQDAVWPMLDVPYLLESGVVLHAPTKPTWTIEPGAELQLEAGREISIADGTLMAIGTAASPIRITSAAASPAPGDWRRVVFSQGAVADIQHAIFEYGGSGGPSTGQIETHVSPISIADSTVQHGAHWGIYLRSGANPTLSNITYVSNPDGDVNG